MWRLFFFLLWVFLAAMGASQVYGPVDSAVNTIREIYTQTRDFTQPAADATDKTADVTGALTETVGSIESLSDLTEISRLFGDKLADKEAKRQKVNDLEEDSFTQIDNLLEQPIALWISGIVALAILWIYMSLLFWLGSIFRLFTFWIPR